MSGGPATLYEERLLYPGDRVSAVGACNMGARTSGTADVP
jgi:hypothetical protein